MRATLQIANGNHSQRVCRHVATSLITSKQTFTGIDSVPVARPEARQTISDRQACNFFCQLLSPQWTQIWKQIWGHHSCDNLTLRVQLIGVWIARQFFFFCTLFPIRWCHILSSRCFTCSNKMEDSIQCEPGEGCGSWNRNRLHPGTLIRLLALSSLHLFYQKWNVWFIYFQSCSG